LSRRTEVLSSSSPGTRRHNHSELPRCERDNDRPATRVLDIGQCVMTATQQPQPPALLSCVSCYLY
jgi:hypothetical protein